MLCFLGIDHSVDLLPIILNHINDTENVVTQFGCMMTIMKVGDFFIEVLECSPAELSPAQLKKLDNALNTRRGDVK